MEVEWAALEEGGAADRALSSSAGAVMLCALLAIAGDVLLRGVQAWEVVCSWDRRQAGSAHVRRIVAGENDSAVGSHAQ